jgi:hypothetical protein
MALDFCLASRRGGRRIASYVTAVVTPKPSKKTSKVVCSLTEIALVRFSSAATRHGATKTDPLSYEPALR